MPVRASWGLNLGEVAVMVLFVGSVVMASRWVDQTGGPMGGFDEMATVEEMGLAASAGATGAANAERCTPPAFVRWLGHEAKWKQHNGC